MNEKTKDIGVFSTFIFGLCMLIIFISIIMGMAYTDLSNDNYCEERGYDYSNRINYVNKELFVECCSRQIGDDSCGHWVPLK